MEKMELFELCINRHWCPKSETFTGADSLLTALDNGWTIHPDVLLRTYRLRSSCLTSVYSFYLQQGTSVALMNVVANPYVEQLIKTHNLIVHSQEIRQNAFQQNRPLYEIFRKKDAYYA